MITFLYLDQLVTRGFSVNCSTISKGNLSHSAKEEIKIIGYNGMKLVAIVDNALNWLYQSIWLPTIEGISTPSSTLYIFFASHGNGENSS